MVEWERNLPSPIVYLNPLPPFTKGARMTTVLINSLTLLQRGNKNLIQLMMLNCKDAVGGQPN
ncbi:hypothetical protein [Thiospirillum jenense]|uniref:Uncharacterized protein n=1 Tax=Thiospirillum jenense TaxID=1653858 RepID=A0A839HFR0_9GAMM|nr:hypothetical protein [Thiospirillum jenense]MBB1126186.1 hypothetical protein [Thiospirillum jenense]